MQYIYSILKDMISAVRASNTEIIVEDFVDYIILSL